MPANHPPKSSPQKSPSKHPPVISPRTSSAVPGRISRKRVADDDEDKENAPDVFTESDLIATEKLEKHIETSRKRLKAKGSLGAEFWSQAQDMTKQELRRHKLIHKRSFHDFVSNGGEKEGWSEDQQARVLREERKSLDLRLRCIERQVQTLLASENNGITQISRRWFMELLTAAPLSKGGVGVGDAAGQGQRPDTHQQSFKRKVIDAYNCDGGIEREGEVWCPILGQFCARRETNAAHIFPYSAGQEAMDNLFGRINGRSEMFEPENGLLMHKDAEKNISLGFMAIVPNIPDQPTAAEQAEWNSATVKSYKLEVINEKAKGAKLRMPMYCEDSNGERVRWPSQHGKVLQFRSEFRPRARYLWWQWAISHLRKIWQDLSDHQRPDLVPLNRPYWGTKGSYVRSGPLSAMAEEVGSRFENLMDAAMDAEDEEGGQADVVDGIGALLTAEHQLTQTRLVKVMEEEEIPGTDDEETEDEDDDDGPVV